MTTVEEQVVQISGSVFVNCENLVCKRKKFIFCTFITFEPVQRFENKSDVSGYRALRTAQATSSGCFGVCLIVTVVDIVQ